MKTFHLETLTPEQAQLIRAVLQTVFPEIRDDAEMNGADTVEELIHLHCGLLYGKMMEGNLTDLLEPLDISDDDDLTDKEILDLDE